MWPWCRCTRKGCFIWIKFLRKTTLSTEGVNGNFSIKPLQRKCGKNMPYDCHTSHQHINFIYLKKEKMSRNRICAFTISNVRQCPAILQEQLSHSFITFFKSCITWHVRKKVVICHVPNSLCLCDTFSYAFRCQHMFDTWSCYHSWKCEREYLQWYAVLECCDGGRWFSDTDLASFPRLVCVWL